MFYKSLGKSKFLLYTISTVSRYIFWLESIQDIQTLISCTGLDDFVNSRISLDKVFRVKEGIVQEEKTDGLV